MLKKSEIVPAQHGHTMYDLIFLLEDKLQELRRGKFDKDRIKDIANITSVAEQLHPTMPVSGTFSNVRNNFRDVKELMDRGYPEKSIIPAAKTLLGAIASPVTEPARLLGRLAQGYNLSYMSPEEMALESDPDKFTKALREHIRDLHFERKDLAPDDEVWPDVKGIDRLQYIKNNSPDADFNEQEIEEAFRSPDNKSSWLEVFFNNMMKNTKGLNKIAGIKPKDWLDKYSDIEKAKNKIKQLLPTLEQSKDNQETINRIADLLSYSEDRSAPILPEYGAFSSVKNNLKDARELLERGYEFQSIKPTSKALLHALLSPVTEPARLLNRYLAGKPLSYMTPKEIANTSDIEKVRSSVEEHLNNLDYKREDPSDDVFGMKGMERLQYQALHNILDRDKLDRLLDDSNYNKLA